MNEPEFYELRVQFDPAVFAVGLSVEEIRVMIERDLQSFVLALAEKIHEDAPVATYG